MNLEQAIETITEGGSVLGLSCDDVYNRMMRNKVYMISLLESVHGETVDYSLFHKTFEMYADELLRETLRANQETKAGL